MEAIHALTRQLVSQMESADAEVNGNISQRYEDILFGKMEKVEVSDYLGLPDDTEHYPETNCCKGQQKLY